MSKDTTIKNEDLTAEGPTSDSESDYEFDMTGCIEPDIVEDFDMNIFKKEGITEEEQDLADEQRVAAVNKFNEGKFEESLKLYEDAIKLNPQSALLFAKRGQVYLKLKRPYACIRDCSYALELNSDSAAAYKFRGRAYRLLGNWENSAKDLRQACKIDFDEQADEWLREVNPYAIKIEQHRLKKERKILDKKEQEKRERMRKAKEAFADTTQEFTSLDVPSLGQQSGIDDFYKLLQDTELMEAFEDPEVAAAFQDLSTNPANFVKYQSNPKVQSVLEKISNKVKSSGMKFPQFCGFDSSGISPGATDEPELD